MSVCTQCGHPLGIGRFCTNCGHPVDQDGPVSEDTVIADDWHGDTAERPAVPDVEHTVVRQRPVLPPPVTGPNEPPRYPLFADEVDQHTQTTRASTMTSSRAAVPPPAPPPAPPPPEATTDTGSGSFRHVGERPPRSVTTWLPWVAGAAVMLLVAVVGAWLLLGNDDDPVSTATDPGSNEQAPSEPQDPDQQSTKSDKQDKQDKRDKDKSSEPGASTDVAGSADASAPATAPPNEDVNGDVVQYDASNMLDGDPQTTWRMDGDGTGETLTFRLAEPTTISEVGMINGYAKTARDGGQTFDWYDGNRRVLEAEWTFDDGTTVSQQLDDTRDLQNVEVDGVPTQTIELRLVAVSPPGSGPSGRNYTAISEVSLVGRPG